jgi:hypothetical protein
MHPFLQDPDAVRLGDWRDLSIQRYGSQKKSPPDKAKNVAGLLAVLSAGAFIALNAHVAQTQEGYRSAKIGPAAIASTELGSAAAMARMPSGFVDDWTFIYPAPQPH